MGFFHGLLVLAVVLLCLLAVFVLLSSGLFWLPGEP